MNLPAFLALGLAALLCPFTHPYDIIWHWSSCHLSPPCLLPLPSSCPPFPLLPARDGSSERRREPSPLLFFSPRRKQQLPVSQRAPVFSFPSVFSPITSALSLYSSLSVFLFHLFSPHRPTPSSSSCLLLSVCLSFSSSVHHQFQFTSRS